MTETHEISKKLASIPLFSDLSPADLRQLGQLAVIKQGTVDEFLLLEKQMGQDLLVLLSGKVAIEISLPSSHELQDVCILHPGDVLGELSLVGIARRSASAKVLEDVSYLVFNSKDLLDLFDQDNSLGYRFMARLAQVLAHRIVGTTKDLGNAFYQIHSSGKFAG